MSYFKSGKRYITKGVEEKIPFLYLLLIWEAIDRSREKRELDYLQVFTFYVEGNRQKIKHSQEKPPYEMIFDCGEAETAITEKVYVIDDGEHQTILLASEY